MCKEKILEILENAKDGNGAVPMRLVRTAFDKLPEPCEDTISRQAAIDALDCINGAEEVLRSLPPAQPEEAIPVSWIESKIERFKAEDNAFCGLTANIMLVMLNEWKREQEGETT